MFKSIFNSILRRSIFVFVILQIGLALTVYSLASLAQIDSIYGTSLWYSLLVAFVLAYGGIALAAFYLLWPIYSVYRRVQEILRWRDWVLSELPKIIAIVPSLLQALREGFDHKNTTSQTSEPPLKD